MCDLGVTMWEEIRTCHSGGLGVKWSWHWNARGIKYRRVSKLTKVANLRDQLSGLYFYTTGGPSSGCDMIILRNKNHGEVVCMGLYGNIYDRS